MTGRGHRGQGPPRRILCQDTDPRARSNTPEAPENPAPYTSTGSPAPVCADVAGTVPSILIPRNGEPKVPKRVTPLALSADVSFMGVADKTAVKWAALAARDWSSYIAKRSE